MTRSKKRTRHGNVSAFRALEYTKLINEANVNNVQLTSGAHMALSASLNRIALRWLDTPPPEKPYLLDSDDFVLSSSWLHRALTNKKLGLSSNVIHLMRNSGSRALFSFYRDNPDYESIAPHYTRPVTKAALLTPESLIYFKAALTSLAELILKSVPFETKPVARRTMVNEIQKYLFSVN